MQSRNPVFNNAEGFNGRAGVAAPAYPGTQYGGPAGYPTTTDRMTIDSVVQKTGLTMGIVLLVAAATWVLTPDLRVDTNALGSLYAISMVGALGGFALSMVNSFKKVTSPALVVAYAAFEGLFVGAFSKSMDAVFGGENNIVVYAVAGTIAAVGGTLAAYKFFDIQVGNRFRKWVTAMVFGFVAVSLLDFVLGFFHADFGFNSFGTVGLLSSILGLAIGVLMLIMDFDYVERGIAAALPERESWRAAFGLTVTIVWIYIELLRILAILNRR